MKRTLALKEISLLVKRRSRKLNARALAILANYNNVEILFYCFSLVQVMYSTKLC